MSDSVKIIAFYLPQYHCIKENDEWWGEGFTEWTNVRTAHPLFKNHKQPKKPLNENYYNLLNHDIRMWQCNLAKKYGVYGFCYYHYWFNGKLLLEQPIEKMLKEPEISLPFCLCWANEPWSRTWEGKNKEILINQEYGSESDWIRHFEYLKQFFLDDRYIKIDNKPVIVIYRSSSIENYDNMINLWREECYKIGFSGIYLVEENNSFQSNVNSKFADAVLDFEPMYTIQYGRTLFEKVCQRFLGEVFALKYCNRIHYYDYDTIWSCILRRKMWRHGKKVFLGAFVDWDNTARKGENGVVFRGGSPAKFEKYLRMQYIRAKEMNSEFVFVNAWNEWAEGTYLEPDNENEYKYLEAIYKIVKQYL